MTFIMMGKHWMYFTYPLLEAGEVLLLLVLVGHHTDRNPSNIYWIQRWTATKMSTRRIIKLKSWIYLPDPANPLVHECYCLSVVVHRRGKLALHLGPLRFLDARRALDFRFWSQSQQSGVERCDSWTTHRSMSRKDALAFENHALSN